MEKASLFKLRHNPSIVIIFSFLLIIFIGALLLSLPFSTIPGKTTSFIDAYFTANSATCVTGLVVVDTGTQYTFWGKLIILGLIQLGGLGYMTFSTLIVILLRQKVFISQRLAVKEALNMFSSQGAARLIIYVFSVVFLVEGTGAFVLFLRWLPEMGAFKALKFGIFHSVSAFCNAGFDIFGNFKSLTEFVGDPVVNLTIMSLIVIGGIGFSVIADIIERRKFSLHSKIVIVSTMLLIVIGAALIFAFENNNIKTIANLSFANKIWASFFQSVSARTAGFNSIDLAGLTGPGIFTIIALMFIGASPGGTGGGIKTTTFAILLLTMIASVYGRYNTEVFGRKISYEVVRKAMTIAMLSFALVIISSAIVSLQGFNFSSILFESTSAFGTVGLSMGITTRLNDLSKIMIALTMFVGRVGPLTLFVGLTLTKKEKRTEFPKEDISIG
ncbi:MAG: trk system potassium uptake protein TrkH [Candidatus Saganbacteria bacterium]|uniref:Trk system potassium uptake protein TrkH n=1 Tax=Candidatus Saganbacteria bacterium TaxID=2575572 RepID=A0A833L266_UNCSA|nr:MAG: trk system potassium uptake protein TrkH [Candidatus Saganbacteria bacterium]